MVLLDQRYLPQREQDFICNSLDDAIVAIFEMVVRGAPAIGITAAYGIVLMARDLYGRHGDQWINEMEPGLRKLSDARPTAVNLDWAINEMRKLISRYKGGDPVPVLLEKAHSIHQQDIEANKMMGENGAELIKKKVGVLTHCNAGALATGGYGTALGVIRSAYQAGLIEQVYADETRPWLQGARLTAWELVKDRIPVSLIADSAAAYLMNQGKVDWVIVGSDRIAANGDVANKIGTYSTAVNARYHGVKFMVVAPTSTIDMSLENGDQIPIETRNADELLRFSDTPIAATGCHGWNPVFDVTPAELVDAIVTERGVVLQPDRDKMERLMTTN